MNWNIGNIVFFIVLGSCLCLALSRIIFTQLSGWISSFKSLVNHRSIVIDENDENQQEMPPSLVIPADTVAPLTTTSLVPESTIFSHLLDPTIVPATSVIYIPSSDHDINLITTPTQQYQSFVIEISQEDIIVEDSLSAQRNIDESLPNNVTRNYDIESCLYARTQPRTRKIDSYDGHDDYSYHPIQTSHIFSTSVLNPPLITVTAEEYPEDQEPSSTLLPVTAIAVSDGTVFLNSSTDAIAIYTLMLLLLGRNVDDDAFTTNILNLLASSSSSSSSFNANHTISTTRQIISSNPLGNLENGDINSVNSSPRSIEELTRLDDDDNDDENFTPMLNMYNHTDNIEVAIDEDELYDDDDDDDDALIDSSTNSNNSTSISNDNNNNNNDNNSSSSSSNDSSNYHNDYNNTYFYPYRS